MPESQQHSIPRQARIILADDHHVVRNGLRMLLENTPNLVIVGEAENGRQVLDLLADNVVADVVITDINMAGMSGIELTAHIKATAPKAKVIVLSMLDSEKYVSQAFKAGASAYLLKNVSAAELTFAIGHVLTGGEYICSEIAMRCMQRLLNAPQLPETPNAAELNLTERDIEVLQLIAEGHTNQEISEKIFTGKRTVEGYRQQLMNKTGSRNSAALIKFAIVNGIIS